MDNAPVWEKIRLARDWGEDMACAHFAPFPRSGRSAVSLFGAYPTDDTICTHYGRTCRGWHKL